jgi:hypothetical protein
MSLSRGPTARRNGSVQGPHPDEHLNGPVQGPHQDTTGSVHGHLASAISVPRNGSVQGPHTDEHPSGSGQGSVHSDSFSALPAARASQRRRHGIKTASAVTSLSAVLLGLGSAPGSRIGPRAPRLRSYGAMKAYGPVHIKEKDRQSLSAARSDSLSQHSPHGIKIAIRSDCPTALSAARLSQRRHHGIKILIRGDSISSPSTVSQRCPQRQPRSDVSTTSRRDPQQQSLSAVRSYSLSALPAATASQRCQHGIKTAIRSNVSQRRPAGSPDRPLRLVSTPGRRASGLTVR